MRSSCLLVTSACFIITNHYLLWHWLFLTTAHDFKATCFLALSHQLLHHNLFSLTICFHSFRNFCCSSICSDLSKVCFLFSGTLLLQGATYGLILWCCLSSRLVVCPWQDSFVPPGNVIFFWGGGFTWILFPPLSLFPQVCDCFFFEFLDVSGPFVCSLLFTHVIYCFKSKLWVMQGTTQCHQAFWFEKHFRNCIDICDFLYRYSFSRDPDSTGGFIERFRSCSVGWCEVWLGKQL